jgi:hypothetical protein
VRDFPPAHSPNHRANGDNDNAISTSTAALLTFEHQGCREFEGDEEETNWQELRGPNAGEGSAESELLRNLRIYRTDIEELLAKANDQWGYEDPVYRYYHQSFKVYSLQEQTKAIVDLLRKLLPTREKGTVNGAGRSSRMRRSPVMESTTNSLIELLGEISGNYGTRSAAFCSRVSFDGNARTCSCSSL